MKKSFKLIFIISLILIMSFYYIWPSNAISASLANNEGEFIVPEEIDYTETLGSFDNPERGFYTYYYYNFKVKDNENFKEQYLKGNLIHLRLGIGAFSGKVNKDKDIELSDEMLNTFDAMLKKIKENGATAIVRFAYDNFEGDENLEPSLDMILKHIEQISPVLTENKDVISYVELGFFGPWGEIN